jgi:hypothetical protein
MRRASAQSEKPGSPAEVDDPFVLHYFGYIESYVVADPHPSSFLSPSRVAFIQPHSAWLLPSSNIYMWGKNAKKGEEVKHGG